MFSPKPTSDPVLEDFRNTLIVGKEYIFTIQKQFSPSWLVRWILLKIEWNMCTFKVIEKFGEWRLTVAGEDEINIRMQILMTDISIFEMANHLGDALTEVRNNQSDIVNILGLRINQARSNQDYISRKREVIECQESLENSWKRYKEEKSQNQAISLPENPRVWLRFLIWALSSFLHWDSIKIEDQILIDAAIRLCINYSDYDKDKITEPILTEYKDLLEKARSKWIEISA